MRDKIHRWLPGLLALLALAGCNPEVDRQSASSPFAGGGVVGTWSETTPTAQYMYAGQAAATAGGVYIHVFGFDGGAGPVTNTWVMDTATGGWSAGGILAAAVTLAAGAVTSADDIWLMGGANGTTVSTVQQCTGPCRFGSGVWTDPSINLQTPTERATAVALGSYIYVMGGCAACFTPITDVQVLETTGPSIATQGNPMAGGVARMHQAAVAHGGLIWVIGGEDGGGGGYPETWRYDPSGDDWTQMAGMLQPIYNGAAVVLNGKVYLMGGMLPGDVVTDSLYIYDIASDTWTQGPDLPARRAAQAATVANGKIYLIGGVDEFNVPTINTYVYTPNEYP